MGWWRGASVPVFGFGVNEMSSGQAPPPMGTAFIQFSPAVKSAARITTPDSLVATQGNSVTITYCVIGAASAWLDKRDGTTIPLIADGTQRQVSFVPTISGDFVLVAQDANRGIVKQPLPFIVQDFPALPPLDPTAAPTFTSTQSGDYASPTTWGGSGPPGRDDIVQISVGHTVTSNGRANFAGRLLIFGTFQQNTGVFFGTDYHVKSGGTLIEDSTNGFALLMSRNRVQHPNDTFSASPDGIAPGFWPALQVDDGGTVIIRGPIPTPFAMTINKGATPGYPQAGDTSLKLRTQVVNWQVGDKIKVLDSRQLTQADIAANNVQTTATALAGATTISVVALQTTYLAGTVLTFGTGAAAVTTTLTANALTGATSLSITSLSAQILSGVTAQGHPVRKYDIAVVRGVSPDGLTVFLLNPLQYDHPCAHYLDGTEIADCFPHVVNLYRQSLFLTSDPTTIATRAHVRFTGRATVDMSAFHFHGTGRTQAAALGNKIFIAPLLYVTNTPATNGGLNAIKITNVPQFSEQPATNSGLIGGVGWLELFTQSTGARGNFLLSEPAPSGNGFLWTTNITGNTIGAGNWFSAVKLSSLTPITADIHVRAFNWDANNPAVFTQIGDMVLTNQAINSTAKVYNVVGAGLPQSVFKATGNLITSIYIDVVLNVTSNPAGTSSITIFRGTASEYFQPANANGRFPCYLDGLIGPQAIGHGGPGPLSNGYQSRIEYGVVMDPVSPGNLTFALNEPQVSWPIVFENSYFHNVNNCVFFNWTGAGPFWKDTASNYNKLNNNLVAVITGDGTRFGAGVAPDPMPDTGAHGMGIESLGPFNQINDNIVNSVTNGNNSTDLCVGIALISELTAASAPAAPFTRNLPAWQGADPSQPGQFTPVNTIDCPFGLSGTGVGDFDRNMIYGCTDQAYENWGTNSRAGDPDEPPWGEGTSLIETVFSDNVFWHTHASQASFPYYGNLVRHLRTRGYSEAANLTDGSAPKYAVYYADYHLNNLVFDSCEYRGYKNFIGPSTVGARCDAGDHPRVLTVKNCTIQCVNALYLGDRWVSGGDVRTAMGPRITTFTNNTYLAVPGVTTTVCTLAAFDQPGNQVAADLVYFNGYNGHNYQIYWVNQQGNFIQRKNWVQVGSDPVCYCCPEGGLTQQQMSAKYEPPHGAYNIQLGTTSPVKNFGSGSQSLIKNFGAPPNQRIKFGTRQKSYLQSMGFRRNVRCFRRNPHTPGLRFKGAIAPWNTSTTLAGFVGVTGLNGAANGNLPVVQLS